MTATSMIRLSSPSDVLSAIPHLLGFTPDQALVLVCLSSHGKGARLGMVARMDLPGQGQAGAAADALLPAVAREDPDAAVVIGYSSAVTEATVAVEVLSGALTEVGVQVRDRMVVVEGRWRSLVSDEPDEPDGHAWTPVPGPDAPAALEFAVASGSAPATFREALTRRCSAGPRAVAVGRECARLAAVEGEVTVGRGAAAWGRLLTDRKGQAVFSDATVALATLSLHAGGRVVLRDALAGWLAPGMLPAEAMDPAAVAALREHLPLPWWSESPGPDDPAAVAGLRSRLLDRLIQVARSLPDEHAVAVLSVLAHTAWLQGNGAVARIAVDRARAADPDYVLAALLDRMVTEGMRPAM